MYVLEHRWNHELYGACPLLRHNYKQSCNSVCMFGTDAKRIAASQLKRPLPNHMDTRTYISRYTNAEYKNATRIQYEEHGKQFRVGV